MRLPNRRPRAPRPGRTPEPFEPMPDLAIIASDSRLTDGVVRLRPWLPSDALAVFAACQDARIARFVPIPQPYTMAVATGYVAFAAADTEAGPSAHLAIVDAVDDTVLGAISRHGGDGHRAAFGYWLAPDARGRGVATRALRLIVDWTLATTAVIRLELYTDPDNDASGAVALRVGIRTRGRPARLGSGSRRAARSIRSSTSGSDRRDDHPRRPRDRRSAPHRPPPGDGESSLRHARGCRPLAGGRPIPGLRSGQVVDREADRRHRHRRRHRSSLRRRPHPANPRPAPDMALRRARRHQVARGPDGPADPGPQCVHVPHDRDGRVDPRPLQRHHRRSIGGRPAPHESRAPGRGREGRDPDRWVPDGLSHDARRGDPAGLQRRPARQGPDLCAARGACATGTTAGSTTSRSRS